MDLARPRAILFDWDNTLVDTWEAIHDALSTTFEAMGREPWTKAQTRARVRQSQRESFPKLFGDRADEAAKIFYRAFTARHLELLRPLPGAEEMLRALLARGCYLGVVSNKRGSILRREAKHLGWTAHFQSLVGAHDAARDKPAVEPVTLALADAPLAAGPEVWFVGDTDIDMVCAINAGCTPILLREQPPEPGEFAAAEPLCHFVTCQALTEGVTAY